MQTCAHCNVQITDQTTMVRQGGQSYCCNNCLQMATGNAQPGSGRDTCAHCQMPIVDSSTQVERNGQTFCCNNCATAMTTGAGSASMGGGMGPGSRG